MLKGVCLLFVAAIAINLSAQPLSVSITGRSSLCNGDTAHLSAIATGGSVQYSYQWSNGDSSVSIDVTSDGQYFVIVSDGSTTDTAIISVTHLLPQAQAIIGISTIRPYSRHTYSVNQIVNHTFDWVVQNGIIFSGQNNCAATIDWNGNGPWKVWLYESFSGCTDTSALNISLDNTSGIADTPEADISIFPNPVTNQISLHAATVKKTLTLVLQDLLGRTLISRTLSTDNNGNDEALDISELNEGIYVLEITDGYNMHVCKKIIKAQP